MADTHEPAQHAHHGPTVKQYLVVFGALAIFTAVSFIANQMVHWKWISSYTSFAIILGVAIVKAVLVGLYFMHLIFDWGKLYYLIFPTFILAVMMITVFMPDIVLNWSNSRSNKGQFPELPMVDGKFPSPPMGGP